ncbi:MAG: hypothetical protein WD740_00795 [Anaerolineales bacterium]
MTITHLHTGQSNADGAATGGPAWPFSANNLAWDCEPTLTGAVGTHFVPATLGAPPFLPDNKNCHGFWLGYYVAAETAKPVWTIHVSKGGQKIEQWLNNGPMTQRIQQIWNVARQTPFVVAAQLFSWHQEGKKGNGAEDIEAYPAKFNTLRDDYVARGLVSPNAIVLIYPRSPSLWQFAIDFNTMLTTLAATNPRWAFVSPLDAETGLPLTTVPGQPVHFDGPALCQLGWNAYHEWHLKKLAGY